MMDMIFDRRYKLLHEIGRGSYGRVWLARDEYGKKEVAVKIYTSIHVDEWSAERLRNQAETFARLRHPNLLPILDMGIGEGIPYVVMPYCPLGTIEKLRGEITETKLWKLINDVASGLEYLDTFELMHLDIKPANVLLGKDESYVISDYGIDRLITSFSKTENTNICGYGGYAYRAPECSYPGEKIVQRSDIWSLGATLFELITGELYILKDRNISFNDYSRQLCNTVQTCLSYDPNKRPSARQLIELSEKMLSKKLNDRIVRYGEIICSKLFRRKKMNIAVENKHFVKMHNKNVLDLMHRCRIVKGENSLYGVMVDDKLMLGYEYDEIREFKECAWPGPSPHRDSYFIGAFFRQKDDVGYFIIRENGIINEYRRCTIEMFSHLCTLT